MAAQLQQFTVYMQQNWSRWFSCSALHECSVARHSPSTNKMMEIVPVGRLRQPFMMTDEISYARINTADILNYNESNVPVQCAPFKWRCDVSLLFYFNFKVANIERLVRFVLSGTFLLLPSTRDRQSAEMSIGRSERTNKCRRMCSHTLEYFVFFIVFTFEIEWVRRHMALLIHNEFRHN